MNADCLYLYELELLDCLYEEIMFLVIPITSLYYRQKTNCQVFTLLQHNKALRVPLIFPRKQVLQRNDHPYRYWHQRHNDTAGRVLPPGVRSVHVDSVPGRTDLHPQVILPHQDLYGDCERRHIHRVAVDVL